MLTIGLSKSIIDYGRYKSERNKLFNEPSCDGVAFGITFNISSKKDTQQPSGFP